MYASARGLRASVDAPMLDRLAGDAGHVVHVLRVEVFVRVGHPRHLALPRSHIGGGHVGGGVQEAFADQLMREAPGDALKLVALVFPWVDQETPLGASEGDVDERAFVAHQRGEGLDLVLVHMGRIADAALGREAVGAVHRAPAREDLELSADHHGEGDLQHRVALFDGRGRARGDVEGVDGSVDHSVDALSEPIGWGHRGYHPESTLRAGLQMPNSWRSKSELEHKRDGHAEPRDDGADEETHAEGEPSAEL